MTFSSRWLLAFRVGGATVALLTHCPVCHVVFNHSSWLIPLLIQTSCTPLWSLCLIADPLRNGSNILKKQQNLRNYFFYIILFPTVFKKKNPSPLLVWNLISAAWSVWEFGPRQVLLVTSSCASAQQKSAHTPVLIFLLLNQHEHQKTRLFRKKNITFGFVMVFSIWTLHGLFASDCVAAFVWGGKMKEEIQMLNCFLSVSCALWIARHPVFKAFLICLHTPDGIKMSGYTRGNALIT